jgi:hypothetical protein
MSELLPVRRFVNEGNDAAHSSLKAYFFPGAFTGSSFETFAQPGINSFTPSDVVAVSMLSVDIPASVTRWILGDGVAKLSQFLTKIDAGLRIESPKADLSNKSEAHKLWREIRRPDNRWGMGETKTSKLLATKRPELFPVFDKHVSKALGISANTYWAPWQEFMRSSQGEYCSRVVQSYADDLGIKGVSVLRLFDVIIWMREHGHMYITERDVDRKSMIPVSYADPVAP